MTATSSNEDNSTAAASAAASTICNQQQEQQDGATASTAKSSSHPLHRHPSISSTTTTNSNNQPPPPSPAQSTTSKTSIYSTRSHSSYRSTSSRNSGSNNSSGSSSSSRIMNQNNMSVDDILNDPMLSTSRMRRRRMKDNKSTATTAATNNAISSRGDNGVSNNTANSSSLQQQQTSTTITTTKINPGQTERKKRLERMQREQLVQRRLLGQQISTTAEAAAGAATAAVSAGLTTTEQSDNETSTKKEEGFHNHDELDDAVEQHQNITPKTVEDALSSLRTKYDSCISTTTTDENAPISSEDAQDKEEGEKAASISTPAASSSASSLSKSTVSPWNVIQVLPQLLQFVHLKQPSTTATATDNDLSNKSGVEQEKQQSYIQKELSKVVISVGMMKRRVMDRTVGLDTATANTNNSNKAGDDEEEEAAQQQQQLVKREASLLQTIQIQLWIRMMMWSLEGEAGWTYLEEVINLTEEEDGKGVVNDDNGGVGKKQRKKKKKRKGKKKQQGIDGMSSTKQEDQQTPRQALVDHLTALFELVPYVLPPSMDFSVWVKDILTFGYRQNIPEYGAEILEHFEIEIVEPIALKRSGTDTSRRSTRSEVSHSPVKKDPDGGGSGSSSPTRQIAERRAKRQQAYFASLMEEEKTSTSTSINADDESATITGSISTVTSTSRGSKRSRGPDIEKDDTKLLKTSLSLTAAVKPKSKENPFLKGSARGTYVGSHLSSKLSNISTLFREVTVPVKKAKMKPTASSSTTTSLLANSKRKAVPKEKKKRRGDVDAGPKAPFNITAKVTREQQLNVGSEKTRVRETPTKKLRVDRTSLLSGRADTYPPLSTPRRIIEETPAKSRRVVISETPQQQPRFRRQQLDLSDITRRQQGKRVRNRQHPSNNNDGLSPMIQYGGLSPMPQKKNVVAEAAKAAARKRK